MQKRCKLCGSDNTKINNKIGEHELIRCLNCRIIFLLPQPKLSKARYHNLIKYESIDSIKSYFNMHEIFIKRAKKCIKILRKYKSSGKILDVGCSFGFYLQVFQKSGFKTKGIDLSEKAIKYINTKLKLKGCNGT